MLVHTHRAKQRASCLLHHLLYQWKSLSNGEPRPTRLVAIQVRCARGFLDIVVLSPVFHMVVACAKRVPVYSCRLPV